MTRREQIAKALREEFRAYRTEKYGEIASMRDWEELPHERKVKWLRQAACAEREVAAAEENSWQTVDAIGPAYVGRTIRYAGTDGAVLIGTLREVGLGFVWVEGFGRVPIRPGARWYVRRPAD